MSALAQLLLALGYHVSGSDRYYDQGRELDILKKLRSLGITLVPQDGRAVTEALDGVVISSAIEADNPDITAARSKGIPVIHRAEMLASLARDKQCIAVTGTAGKTTVTGMIGWTLADSGLDPTVVNGGAVLNWVNEQNPGNFRFGHSNLWVLELDESDRSLLNFHPDWAVVTNISKDHFELTEVRKLFALFSRQVKKKVIGCDPEAGTGISRPDFHPALTKDGIVFKYKGVEFRLALLGRHNAENALHCVMLCEKLGLDLNDVSRALKKFAGIERRLEVIGRTGGIIVVDDYAHNPAKISAAWQAVEPLAKRIIAVWRPHGYGPLALMRRELVDVFSGHVRAQDRIIIMEVYFAGGTAKKEVTARMLADDLARKGLPVGYVEDYEALRSDLLKSVKSGDAVLFMGARDPDLPVFVRRFLFEFNNFVMDRMPGPGGIAKEDKAADQA
jgi:UDP-N-acetylmuramate--alanine ligase